MAPVVVDRGKYFLRERLDNGEFRETISASPLHYRDDSNNWQPISLSWVDSGIPTRPNGITAASLMVTVADDGMRRIHPTRDLNKYIEIGAPHILVSGNWTKVNLGAPTRSAGRLTWITANANVVIDHGGHYIKLWIELKDPDQDGIFWQPNQGRFAFPVGIQGLTRSGQNILDGSTVVMVLKAPHIEDGNNPTDQRDIAFDFRSVTISGSSTPVLHMQLPDISGMTKPIIDPTVNLQPDASAGVDTSMTSDNPTFNWGVATSLFIGESNSAVSVWRALIKFDLSSIPANAEITSATLSLYANLDRSSNARTFRVYRQKRAWVEGTRNGAADSPATGATWNRYDTTNNWSTAGGFHADDCEQTDIGSRSMTATETLNQFKDFALTPTTKAGLDLGFGWLIKADTETDDAYAFTSSDDGTAANRPKLVIIYTVPQNLDMPFISATSTVYTPTMDRDITMPFISATSTVYTPTMDRDITMPFIGSSAAVYAPTVAITQVLTMPLIVSTAQLFAPSVVIVTVPSILTLTNYPYVDLTLTNYLEEGVPMTGDIHTYDIGDRPTIQGEFELNGAGVDPAIVRVQVKKPNGIVLNKAYPADGEIVRVSVGVFLWRLSPVVTGEDGYWTFRMSSENSYETAEWDQFFVRPDPIT